MGSKIKITDTSGNRIPKKQKPNQVDLTASSSELSLNENPVGGSGASAAGSFQNIQINDGEGGFFADDSGNYYNGNLTIGGDGANGSINIKNTSNFTTFIQYTAGTQDVTLFLPNGVGGTGTLLESIDGSGNLQWTDYIHASNGSRSYDINSRAISDGLVGTSVDGFNRTLNNSAANPVFAWGNGVTYSLTAVSSTVNVTKDFYYYDINTEGGTVTINLPSASGIQGATFVITDANGTAAVNNATIVPNGSDTIIGSSSFVLNTNNQSVTIHSDGTSKWIIT